MKFTKGQSVNNPFSKRSGVITGFSKQHDGIYLLLNGEKESLTDGHEDYWELEKEKTIEKRKEGFYWIKWDKNSEWEVAKYDPKIDRFKGINGSHMSPKSILEIDERIIEKKLHY